MDEALTSHLGRRSQDIGSSESGVLLDDFVWRFI